MNSNNARASIFAARNSRRTIPRGFSAQFEFICYVKLIPKSIGVYTYTDATDFNVDPRGETICFAKEYSLKRNPHSLPLNEFHRNVAIPPENYFQRSHLTFDAFNVRNVTRT